MAKRFNTLPIAANTQAQNIEVGLVVCSIDLAGLSEGSNSQRVHLIPSDSKGKILGADGRQWQLNAENIIANAQKTKTDIPVDYHHASLSAKNTGAIAPAAGWIKPSSIEANSEGIFGTVEWTDTALNQLQQREFRYVSPVFTHTRSGETVALKGLALTHYPNLGDLEAVANSNLNSNSNNKESYMEELIDEIREALNLPTAANAAEIKIELDKVFGRMATLAANSDASLAEQVGLIETRLEGAETKATDAIAANSQQDLSGFVPRAEFDAVRSELTTITKNNEDERVQTAVNAAIESGVIAPASKGWAEDLCRNNQTSFDAFVANASQVVPLGEEKHGDHNHSQVLTNEELAVCSQLGLSSEEFIKSKKQQENV